MNQPWSQFFLTWLPIKVVLRMKMMKILVYRVWTQRNIAAFVVNFHCATNAHLQMKMTKFQVGKLESLLRIVCLAQKRHTVLNTFCRRRSFRNFWSKGSIFTVSFTNEHALSWARACFSDMHESSLLTYYHNPSVFHCQRPCNGYHELYSWQNIDFTLKNHCPTRPLLSFLWCSSSVRLN